MKKIFFILSGCAFLFACSQQKSTTETAAPAFNLDSVKAAIEANNAVFIAAMKKGDSATMASCYTKDGCMMAPNMPKACGSQALGGMFGGMHKMGLENLKLQVTEVLGTSELVSEEGTYELLTNEGASMEKGKYLVTWKMEDGKWKKYRDIFNADAPPPPPAK